MRVTACGVTPIPDLGYMILGLKLAHDLFRKTGSHPRIKSKGKLFRVMLVEDDRC